jgi:hypothetical protein
MGLPELVTSPAFSTGPTEPAVSRDELGTRVPPAHSYWIWIFGWVVEREVGVEVGTKEVKTWSSRIWSSYFNQARRGWLMMSSCQHPLHPR